MPTSYCDEPDVGCLHQQPHQSADDISAGRSLRAGSTAAAAAVAGGASFSVSGILHCPPYDVDDDEDDNDDDDGDGHGRNPHHQPQRQTSSGRCNGSSSLEPEVVHDSSRDPLQCMRLAAALPSSLQQQQQRSDVDGRPEQMIQTSALALPLSTAHYRSSTSVYQPAGAGFMMTDVGSGPAADVGSQHHALHPHQYPCSGGGGSNVDELFHLQPSSATGGYHQALQGSSSSDGLMASGTHPNGTCSAWYAAMTAGYGDDVTSAASRHHCKYSLLMNCCSTRGGICLEDNADVNTV